MDTIFINKLLSFHLFFFSSKYFYSDATIESNENINATPQSNTNVNMIKSKKLTPVCTQQVSSSQPLRSKSGIATQSKNFDLKHKKEQANQKDFSRNKSYASPEEFKKSVQKRAISAAGSYALSNIVNIGKH